MLYKMFDLCVEICELIPQTASRLLEYKASDDILPDIKISITLDELQAEKEKDPKKSDSYCEMVCIFRHIAEEIVDFNGIFVHSAVVKKDDKGFMFLGRSGAGKSTHVIGWLKTFVDAKVINGDKPILRFFDDCIYAYGSPWCGIEGLNKNERVRLYSGAFVEKATKNSIYPISDKEVFSKMLNQTVVPLNPQKRIRHFEFLDKLIKSIPFYILECDISKEAVITAYEKMGE